MFSDITDDAAFDGGLRLRQRRRGYRFTEDALFLAAFAAARGPVGCVIDLGAGCGVIGFALAARGLARQVVAVELQEGLSRCAAWAVGANGLGGVAQVLRADFRALPLRGACAELVVANPPWLPLDAGRLPPDPERSRGRHEHHGGLEEILDATRDLLCDGGRAALVFPCHGEGRLRAALGDRGFRITRWREARARVEDPPTRLLVEVVVGAEAGSRPVVEPPLVGRDAEGRMSRESRAIYRGEWGEPPVSAR